VKGKPYLDPARLGALARAALAALEVEVAQWRDCAANRRKL